MSSGVRRVEAVAGEAALAWLAGQMAELDAARGLFKQLPDGLAPAVAAVQDEAKALQKEVAEARAAQATAGLDAHLDAAQDVDGVRVVVARMDGTPADTLRDLAEQARARMGDAPGVAVFASADGEKVALAASATDAAVAHGRPGRQARRRARKARRRRRRRPPDPRHGWRQGRRRPRRSARSRRGRGPRPAS